MNRPQQGMTLIELLVCIIMLSVVISVTGTIFAEIIRIRAAHEKYEARRDAAVLLLRRVAKEIRESYRFAVGRDGAELTIYDGNFTLVYRAEPGRVERTSSSPEGSQSETVLLSDNVNVRFSADGPDVSRSAVMTAEWDEDLQVGISHPVLSLRAAVRMGL